MMGLGYIAGASSTTAYVLMFARSGLTVMTPPNFFQNSFSQDILLRTVCTVGLFLITPMSLG